MKTRVGVHTLWVAAALLPLAATTVAQDRLVIDVSKAVPPETGSKVIHYQGSSSVHNSDERSYKQAEARRSAYAAESRSSAEPAGERLTRDAESRQTAEASQRSTSTKSTIRYGSVRLDTIR